MHRSENIIADMGKAFKIERAQECGRRLPFWKVAVLLPEGVNVPLVERHRLLCSGCYLQITGLALKSSNRMYDWKETRWISRKLLEDDSRLLRGCYSLPTSQNLP
jgi:hypothetical protein